MVLLALVSILLLIVEIVTHLNSGQIKLIQYIDIAIALIFLAEFILHFYKAQNRLTFLKNRWWELLAAIPITSETTQALRAIKLARALPLIESLKFIRFTARLKIILEASQKYTHQTYLIYLTTILSMIILSGALGFYYFEININPNLHNFWDSIYWAITTTATVGAGNLYAITPGGKIVTIFLILTGVGTLGALVAAIDIYVIRHEKKGF